MGWSTRVRDGHRRAEVTSNSRVRPGFGGQITSLVDTIVPESRNGFKMPCPFAYALPIPGRDQIESHSPNVACVANSLPQNCCHLVQPQRRHQWTHREISCDRGSAAIEKTVNPTPVVALTATLDHPAPVIAGTALPPLWHWLYFLTMRPAERHRCRRSCQARRLPSARSSASAHVGPAAAWPRGQSRIEPTTAWKRTAPVRKGP
jgi:hypothetical protein